jgi:hypothetical protein
LDRLRTDLCIADAALRVGVREHAFQGFGPVFVGAEDVVLAAWGGRCGGRGDGFASLLEGSFGAPAFNRGFDFLFTAAFCLRDFELYEALGEQGGAGGIGERAGAQIPCAEREGGIDVGLCVMAGAAALRPIIVF